MVNFILFLFLLPFFLQASSIEMTSSGPGKASLLITHEMEEKIDETSFQMEGKSLAVQWQKSVPLGDQKTEIAIYTFLIPTKGSLLPPVKVKVGGIWIESRPIVIDVSSIEVFKDENAIFKLEAGVTHVDKIYPGQRFHLFYRFSFNQSIALTQESLPLFEVSGLKPIGDKKFSNLMEEGLTVQVVSQEVEAIEPGQFAISESSAKGKVQATGGSVEAIAKGFTITVNAFPQEGMPPSFNGALGVFSVAGQITERDQDLQYTFIVKGESGLHTVKFPSLKCQKTLSGWFKPLNSIKIAQKGDVKTFVQSYLARSPYVNTFPALDFSSFDPVSETYLVVKTEPLMFTPHLALPGLEVNHNPSNIDWESVFKKVPLRNTLKIKGELFSYPWLLSAFILASFGIAFLFRNRAKVQQAWEIRKSSPTYLVNRIAKASTASASVYQDFIFLKDKGELKRMLDEIRFGENQGHFDSFKNQLLARYPIPEHWWLYSFRPFAFLWKGISLIAISLVCFFWAWYPDAREIKLANKLWEESRLAKTLAIREEKDLELLKLLSQVSPKTRSAEEAYEQLKKDFRVQQ